LPGFPQNSLKITRINVIIGKVLLGNFPGLTNPTTTFFAQIGAQLRNPRVPPAKGKNKLTQKLISRPGEFGKPKGYIFKLGKVNFWFS